MPTVEAELEFKARILRETPFFRGAAEGDIDEFARVAKLRATQRGKSPLKAGQDGSHVFILQTGVCAQLHYEFGAHDPILVGLHGPGSLVGVVSALRRHAEGATPDGLASRRFEALSNMTALVAPAADFLRICRRNSELSEALSLLLARRNQEIAALFAQATHYSLERRLASFFAEVAKLTGANDWNPVTNVGRLSQSSIAVMLGVSREHVNRSLSIWERSGLIFQNKKGEILVLNSRRLTQIAATRPSEHSTEKYDDWLWEIDAHLNRGLNQTALHLALEAAKRAPKDNRYFHRAVLASARLGGISEALALAEKWKLSSETDDEELSCLRPRLLRDFAFARAQERPDMKLLAESAREYEAVFARTGGSYSGVNAAAGYALTGETEKARKLAADVWALLGEGASEECDTYWRRTTLAECKLLQGDAAAAATLFEAAAAAEDATAGKRASTRKQLKRLAPSLGLDQSWLDRMVPQPAVMFFSGPLAYGGAARNQAFTARLVDAVRRSLNEKPVGWAYGALASGADIVIAETLLDSGVELHVCLPLAPEEFLNSSVLIGGSCWRERFTNCVKAASSIDWIRRTQSAGAAVYRFGALFAMGRAIRQADQLETEAIGLFATQARMTPASSLSISNAELWRLGGFPFIEIADDWPVSHETDSAKKETEAELYFALVVQDKNKPATATGADFDRHVRDDGAGLDIFLFKSVERACEAAAKIDLDDASRAGRCWLDAGIFDEFAISEPAAACARLITAACQPLTEPGKVYASDAFACTATALARQAPAFEYLGFVQTREKLDPCALYLVRF